MRTLKYHCYAGSRIETACRESAALARKEKALVWFEFNEEWLFATPKKSPSTILWEWRMLNEMRRYHPKAVADRKRSENEHETQNAQRQRTVNTLVGHIPKNESALMAWMKEYALLTDWTGVDRHSEIVLKKLSEIGYVANDLVGNPSDFFKTRSNMARWITGQVMTCLESGMPPHPVTAKFVDDYLNMPI